MSERERERERERNELQNNIKCRCVFIVTVRRVQSSDRAPQKKLTFVVVVVLLLFSKSKQCSDGKKNNKSTKINFRDSFKTFCDISTSSDQSTTHTM